MSKEDYIVLFDARKLTTAYVSFYAKSNCSKPQQRILQNYISMVDIMLKVLLERVYIKKLGAIYSIESQAMPRQNFDKKYLSVLVYRSKSEWGLLP
jgi:hypothetical protein